MSYFCQETVRDEGTELGTDAQEVSSTSLNGTVIPSRTEQVNFSERIGKIDGKRGPSLN